MNELEGEAKLRTEDTLLQANLSDKAFVVSTKSTKDRVRAFVETNFYIADKSALTDDVSLLEKGLVDSTGILEIVSFIESDFSIKVEDTELVPENLDSIARITAFISRKQAS